MGSRNEKYYICYTRVDVSLLLCLKKDDNLDSEISSYPLTSIYPSFFLKILYLEDKAEE